MSKTYTSFSFSIFLVVAVSSCSSERAMTNQSIKEARAILSNPTHQAPGLIYVNAHLSRDPLPPEAWALSVLSLDGDGSDLALIRPSLDETNDVVRCAAIQCWGNLAPASELDALLRFLNDRSAHIRRFTADVLANRDFPKYASEISKLKNDSDPDVRLAVDNIFRLYSNKFVPADSGHRIDH